MINYFKCSPKCSWRCDKPNCPGNFFILAVCEPICEKPRCTNKCEPTLYANC